MSPRLASLLLVFITLAACAEVPFNEKERLNDPIMAFDDDEAGAEMRQHMITPRESAHGGFSGAGAGGCSCR